jgi:hypothetical protein
MMDYKENGRKHFRVMPSSQMRVYWHKYMHLYETCMRMSCVSIKLAGTGTQTWESGMIFLHLPGRTENRSG